MSKRAIHIPLAIGFMIINQLDLAQGVIRRGVAEGIFAEKLAGNSSYVALSTHQSDQNGIESGEMR